MKSIKLVAALDGSGSVLLPTSLFSGPSFPIVGGRVGGGASRNNISRVASPSPLVKKTPRAPADPDAPIVARWISTILLLLSSSNGDDVPSPSLLPSSSFCCCCCCCDCKKCKLSDKVVTSRVTTGGSNGTFPISFVSSSAMGGANACNTIRLAVSGDKHIRNVEIE